MATQILKNKSTILVVDDEPLIRKTIKRLLEKLGFLVLLADSGTQALRVYKEQMDKVSLIVLDMSMPLMSGEQTFEELININPNAKILLSSGYTKSEGIEELINNGAVGFVQKPYDLSILASEVENSINVNNSLN